MTIKKDDAINHIHADFEELANLVLEQLDLMEQVIISGEIEVPDEDLKRIQTNEKDIDKREVKLSDKIVNAIVLYKPVASDLRWIMACYRIILSLERIGDIVINITDFVKKIKTPEVYEKLREVLSNMTIQSIKMVRKSLLAYLNDDREFAVWTIKNDVVFDEINHKLLKKIIAKTDTAESNKHLLMSIVTIKEMMSNIERIADHATNIAEAAIYSIEGKDVRHHKLDQ
ncbi:phosphate signaling complex PhoU family protein [Sunxiuqinia elliptica]|uniref:Phosphate transport system protein n=1 Tax=Sunxiuqinia elliptica TaxID=655355 RepID=A0A4R6H5X6_9BACT|nr:PhoU domain-containing protein [Sunxiuqinia elliptica]TDO03693.1 phosphate transport system protein [Sunxiuqinia elliptica]TDO61974.1 phosphate transport system protein [Sunxiuqinia elliptica]